MGAYVTVDSLDAGRRWNSPPPGIGQGYVDQDSMDAGRRWRGRTPRTGRDDGLAQDFSVLQAVTSITSAAITAGGTIGAAAINADATKYAVNAQTKANLTVALANENAALEQAKATLEAQKAAAAAQQATAEQTTEQVQIAGRTTTQATASLVPVITILGLAGIAAFVILKKD